MGMIEWNKDDWMNKYDRKELGWLNERVWMKGIRMTEWMGMNEGNMDDWMNGYEWRELGWLNEWVWMKGIRMNEGN